MRAAVVGGTGYAGGEVLRLLAGHPELEVAAVTGQANAGRTLGAVHPHLRSLAGVPVRETGADAVRDADIVFLALPHSASAGFAAHVPPGVPVVDLGSDHRLVDPADHAAYYGGEHAAPWTYGLPELPGQRARIAAASRVANTGCHAAAAILALAPLTAAGVIEPHDVVITSISGTSGAGRAAQQHLLGSEVMGDLSAYKVGVHRHVPEIKQASGVRSLTMTPVLAPMPRGILACVAARPARLVTAADVRDVLAAAYDAEPFVHVLPDGQQPHTAATLGSNSAHLQATVDADTGRVLVTSALDNLGKGAAGQAVQLANLMLGLPETAGLPVDGVAP